MSITTESYMSKPQGKIPKTRFPLLVQRNAFPGGGAEAIKARFRETGWSNNCDDPGIYEYAHATTHECLGCARGRMAFSRSVGEGGWTKLRIEQGDVIVMPTGVRHEMISMAKDIHMCGGHPDGREWDDIQEAFPSDEDDKRACKRIMMPSIPAKHAASGLAMPALRAAPSSVEGAGTTAAPVLTPPAKGTL